MADHGGDVFCPWPTTLQAKSVSEVYGLKPATQWCVWFVESPMLYEVMYHEFIP
jgi:hypothetical protein